MFFSTDIRCGNDVLIGGTGDDSLYGDADPLSSDFTNVTGGADRFVFADGTGLDTIFDFQNAVDLIDLTGFAGITGFAQIDANAVPGGVDDTDTVIDLGAAAGATGGQDVLTLLAFNAADLDATDFLFA